MRTRSVILATSRLLLVGLAFAAGRVRPVALVLPLVDVELWPVPFGLRVRILDYGSAPELYAAGVAGDSRATRRGTCRYCVAARSLPVRQ